MGHWQHGSSSVALSFDGRTLYSSGWVGNVVELIDPATMAPCGYIKADSAGVVVAVPGVIPTVACVKTQQR